MKKGIYKITNKINGKCYIGKSSDIEKRWNYHKISFNYEKEKQKTLYRAFRKYGIENFTFEILEEMTEELYDQFANNREEYWILFYNSFNNGYNETKGGDGGYIEKGVEKNRKLTVSEVEHIRDLYSECKLCLDDAYNLYKDRMTKRGFQAVWLGQNYKKIKPEVFSEENKRKHIFMEHQRQGRLRKEKKNG